MMKGFLQRRKLNIIWLLINSWYQSINNIKSTDVVGDKRLSLEVGVEAKLKCNSVMSVTNCSAIACRTRSKVAAANDRMVISTKRPAENISGKQQCKTSRSFTSTSNGLGHKRSTVRRLNTNPVIQFTKTAESRLRLPVDVASDLFLYVDNLCDVTIQNLRSEH